MNVLFLDGYGCEKEEVGDEDRNPLALANLRLWMESGIIPLRNISAPR